MDLSSCLFTAPGTVSKNAGQPHPELLHVSLFRRGVLIAERDIGSEESIDQRRRI